MAKAHTFPAMAVTLVLVVACLPGALADANLVSSTCRRSDYDQCLAMLSTDLRSASATTVRDLAGIGLDVAAANAWESSGFLGNEADKQRDGGEAANALRRCVLYYHDAVAALRAARARFDAGAYAQAQAQAMAAANAGNRCKQEFFDHHLQQPAAAIVEVNERMKDWNAVAGDLIDMLLTS